MRKIFLVLLFLMVFSDSGFAQNGAEITQFFPHFVAGSLSASDWESEIMIVNLAGEPNNVVIDFFDNIGNPQVVATSYGTNSSFVVALPRPALESVSSDILKIFRNSGGFVTGWVKMHSTRPFGADLAFEQFVPGGTESVGKADVPPSPVENVLTYPLAPNNGVALVNPSSQDANVTFTAFNRAGNKIGEGKFVLIRGTHKAMFFKEDPFFLDATGIIVIASNIPLSSIALEFKGLVFKTIPRLPTPRRLDYSQRADTKIGFVYIYSNDRQVQPNIQDRFAEYIEFQKTLLDREMLLNGFNRVQLPYDFDENGLPKVEIIDGGNREQYFNYNGLGYERVYWDVIYKTIDARVPSNWSQKVIFFDMWLDREVNGQRDDIIISGGGSWSFISARYLPFLSKKYFGDKRPFHGVPISEFGGKPMSNGDEYGAKTFEDLADTAISIVNHENGHSFFSLGHSDAGGSSRFRSMMGNAVPTGCMNPTRTKECGLLPIEANGVSLAKISKPNDFDWIDWNPSQYPSQTKVGILSKEIVGSRIRATFRVEDQESGVNSFSVQTYNRSPWTRFWKVIGHLENLENITFEADVLGASINDMFLIVINNQGKRILARLF